MYKRQDLEIAADGTQTLDEAHQIAEHVHHAIEHTFPDVKHCIDVYKRQV